MLDERILVITGAGISAESGISTFRGKNGYWRNLDPAKLATPQAFRRDPHLVWEWYRERRNAIRNAQPNPAHVAITRLANESRHFLLITQNVDDLHIRAAHDGKWIAPDHLVQIHGDIFLTRCSRCDFQFFERSEDTPELPLCEKCGAMMRPGIVWFGEMLDPARIDRVEAYLAEGPCDHVLVIGTTAMFGYIIDWALRAAQDGARLIEVNPDVTPLSEHATDTIREPAGSVLPGLVHRLLS
ncbi:MAG: Sir2 family NAD-dependent protein deacetylase [Chthoniobacterales bacterium]